MKLVLGNSTLEFARVVFSKVAHFVGKMTPTNTPGEDIVFNGLSASKTYLVLLPTRLWSVQNYVRSYWLNVYHKVAEKNVLDLESPMPPNQDILSFFDGAKYVQGVDNLGIFLRADEGEVVDIPVREVELISKTLVSEKTYSVTSGTGIYNIKFDMAEGKHYQISFDNTKIRQIRASAIVNEKKLWFSYTNMVIINGCQTYTFQISPDDIIADGDCTVRIHEVEFSE